MSIRRSPSSRTTGRTRAAAAATLATLAGTVLVAAPAEAATSEHVDQAGDVTRIDGDQAPGEGTVVPDGSPDVTAVRVRGGAHRLVVDVDLADLRREGRLVGATMLVRTPTRRFYVTDYSTYGRGRWHRWADITTARGRAVDCRGFDASLDFAGDTAHVAVPWRCLAADSARVGVWSFRLARHGERTWVDDAYRDGRAGDRPTLSEPVTRS